MKQTEQNEKLDAMLEAAVMRRIADEKKKAREAVDFLRSLGIYVRFDSHGTEPTPKPAGDSESWTEAIDRVLSEATTALTVVEIAKKLKAEGRPFPEKGRLEAPIANTVGRRGKAMGWTSHGRPMRWRKEKEKGGPSS